MVKIFTRVLCTDVEYKTLSIYNHTTCKWIVKTILDKFRLKHRDPKLFYLTLEAWIKQTGIPIRSVMSLEDDACPALLQSCYTQKDLKYVQWWMNDDSFLSVIQCHSSFFFFVLFMLWFSNFIKFLIRFTLMMRRGSIVKVYDTCFQHGVRPVSSSIEGQFIIFDLPFSSFVIIAIKSKFTHLRSNVSLWIDSIITQLLRFKWESPQICLIRNLSITKM